MSNGYVIPIDPSELATRFSDPRFDDEDEVLDDADEASSVSNEAFAQYLSEGDYESRIEPLLDRIPEREADYINLYFIHKKRQADIAAIFNVTQAAVSYRLDRGIRRLKFLLELPQVSEDELRDDLREVFPAKSSCPKCSSTPGHCPLCRGTKSILIDVEILVGMWHTTCQSEVATRLGLTQGRVRHRFFNAVEVLEAVVKKDEKYIPYQKIFSSISNKGFNLLREVKLPQWQNRGGDECT